MIVKALAYYSLSAVCVMYQKAFSLEEKRGHPILRSTNTFNAATSGPSNHRVPTLLATTQVTLTAQSSWGTTTETNRHPIGPDLPV